MYKYIVKRTQLSLDKHLWSPLHARAQSQKTTISELVRQAVRERHIGDLEKRKQAMQGFVGIHQMHRKDPDARQQVRLLRGGKRLDGLDER